MHKGIPNNEKDLTWFHSINNPLTCIKVNQYQLDNFIEPNVREGWWTDDISVYTINDCY